jgi:GH43 family beta-xylosidase
MFHEGFYYFSVTRGDHISLRKAASILDLPQAPDVEIWRDPNPERCMHMWAPEFYFLDGRWYLYYTASGKNHLHHRCFVLESEGTDPMGPYHFKAKLLTDVNDSFYAIDGSALRLASGQTLFFYAGFPDHRIFMAEMSNPWTLKGERKMLKASGFGCREVREGPIPLVRNGRIFLIYSICDTAKPDYKLGMLVADEKADLLDPKSWKQFRKPVFERCDANGVYGPGHNSFFRSPDGTQDWICYHAKATTRFTCKGRTPRIQQFFWDKNGFPEFGAPLSLKTPIPLPSGDPGRQ